MHPDRWEHGSDFPLRLSSAGAVSRIPWADEQLHGTGRSALRALVAHGIATRGWRRLWIPSYYCPEAIRPLLAEPIELAGYRHLPGAPPELPPARRFRRGDVVLELNLFGLDDRPELARGVERISDHTHAPASAWALDPTREYAFASLRKSLPVPDGAAAWSPCGLPLPKPPRRSTPHEHGALSKLAGMALKALYLDGASVAKEAFRQLLVDGESAIAKVSRSAISRGGRELLRLCGGTGDAARRSNFAAFSRRLGTPDGVMLLQPRAPGATPFYCTLVFERASQRTAVHQALLSRRVYPAMPWTLDPTLPSVGKDELSISRRLLVLHCDARYGAADMERVAIILLDLLAGA
jgi:hypothetical protein